MIEVDTGARRRLPSLRADLAERSEPKPWRVATMGQPEMYVAVMAGVVLSLFLGVSEVVALRKAAFRLYGRWARLSRSGNALRVAVELCGIAAVFLLQTVIVAVLVALALGTLNPRFPHNVSRQIRLDTIRHRYPGTPLATGSRKGGRKPTATTWS